MQLSRLALHLPDADQLTGREIGAVLELKPAAMLVLVYARWDNDKGVAVQVCDLVRALGHDRLYVRFHADPSPPAYARGIGGAREWGALCARRMDQYYGGLGITLHALLANEADATDEGGLSPRQASQFYAEAIGGYRAVRRDDIMHIPAPTGAPETHRDYLERYRDDGWVHPDFWVDGHGYNGDLERVIDTIHDVLPNQAGYVITETNDLDDFGWPINLVQQGRVADVIYFTLNWARGGEGRVQPPSADDVAKRMSLLRFPDRYAQFKATIGLPVPEPAPEPAPEPEEPMPEFPIPVDDAGQEWAPSKQDIIDGAIAVADEAGLPRDLMLALCLAESGEGLQSLERWYLYTVAANAAIVHRDRAALQGILDRIAAAGTNDISFGPCHQTWRWSPEYNGQPYDLQSILEFRKLYIQDHGHALRVARDQIKNIYDNYPAIMARLSAA